MNYRLFSGRLLLSVSLKWVQYVFFSLLMISFSGCDFFKTKPSFQHMDISGGITQPDFKLTDHNGRAVNLATFKGKVVVVFFGFTHCPDICPITLHEWKQAFERLGDDQKDVVLLLMSVDPRRDTLERLKTYTQSFHPNFLGLSGDLPKIKSISENYKAFFAQNQQKPESIDHTAASYVIDKTGQVRLFVQHEGKIDRLAEDLKTLIRL